MSCKYCFDCKVENCTKNFLEPIEYGGIPKTNRYVDATTIKILMNRIFVCESLPNRKKIGPFLKHLVTGDKKWNICDNKKRNRSWWSNNSKIRMGNSYGSTIYWGLLLVLLYSKRLRCCNIYFKRSLGE